MMMMRHYDHHPRPLHDGEVADGWVLGVGRHNVDGDVGDDGHESLLMMSHRGDEDGDGNYHQTGWQTPAAGCVDWNDVVCAW